MRSTFSYLKRYIFPLIMMFALIIFGVKGFTSFAVDAGSSRIISVSKDTDLSTISLKNKSILKLGKDMNSSFDLSKLPAVTEKTNIVIEIGNENEEAEITFNGKLPDNYEVPLIICNGYSYAKFSENSYNPSVYYPNKGTEKNPDILDLRAAIFDLSLLPDKTSSTYLCIMDTCKTKGIDFGDSILPTNYVVSKIFILHEDDKQTFKSAFPKAEVSVMSIYDMNAKLVELFNVDSTNSSDKKQESTNSSSSNITSGSSSTQSTTSDNKTAPTKSTKSTGDNVSYLYYFGGSFILFSTLLFLSRKKKSN